MFAYYACGIFDQIDISKLSGWLHAQLHVQAYVPIAQLIVRCRVMRLSTGSLALVSRCDQLRHHITTAMTQSVSREPSDLQAWLGEGRADLLTPGELRATTCRGRWTTGRRLGSPCSTSGPVVHDVVVPWCPKLAASTLIALHPQGAVRNFSTNAH